MANKEMSQKEALYIKKVNKRKLGGSLEFTTSRLAWQISLAFTAFFLYQAFTKGGMWFAVAGVILGAVVANLLSWGIASINGMAVATVCYVIGQKVSNK